MDTPKLDHVSKSLSSLGTRRSGLQALMVMPVMCATLAVTDMLLAQWRHMRAE